MTKITASTSVVQPTDIRCQSARIVKGRKPELDPFAQLHLTAQPRCRLVAPEPDRRTPGIGSARQGEGKRRDVIGEAASRGMASTARA
jgi:hypothetical protein